MRLIVVRRRDVSVPLDVATLETRIRWLILGGSVSGRTGKRGGWIWWHSLSSTSFHASFERHRSGVEIMADLTARGNETELSIKLGVAWGSAMVMAIWNAYFVCIGLIVHNWALRGYLALFVLFVAWMVYGAIKAAIAFVDGTLIPALSAPIGEGGEPPLPRDYGQVPWRPWNWVPPYDKRKPLHDEQVGDQAGPIMRRTP